MISASLIPLAEPDVTFTPSTYKVSVSAASEYTVVTSFHAPACRGGAPLTNASFRQPALDIPVPAVLSLPWRGVAKKYLLPYSASSVTVPSPKIQRFAPSSSQFTNADRVTASNPLSRSEPSLPFGISMYPLLDVALPPSKATNPAFWLKTSWPFCGFLNRPSKLTVFPDTSFSIVSLPDVRVVFIS
ncbi:hypothetical protein D3C77_293340 [compost metagenome]